MIREADKILHSQSDSNRSLLLQQLCFIPTKRELCIKHNTSINNVLHSEHIRRQPKPRSEIPVWSSQNDRGGRELVFFWHGSDWIRLFLRPSAMMNASSSDCDALSRGSQWMWYRELRSSKVTARDPPMHSVTFCPVISRCTPPGWLPSCSWTSKNARTSAW